MGVAYDVCAKIVDINVDEPRANDRLLLDSNVLFQLTYTNASYSEAGHIYESYVKKLKEVGARLFWCGLSYAELAHIIEETEFQMAVRSSCTTCGTPKEYRNSDRKQWERVVEEIKSAWGLVCGLAEPLECGLTVDAAATDRAAKKMANSALGGYDVFMAEAVSANSLTGILTNDGDFSTVAGLQVFTGNRNVLALAKGCNRVMSRGSPQKRS